MSLIDLDARVEALRAHQLPAYTGKPTPTGGLHHGRWNRHVAQYGLPAVVANLPLPGNHTLTLSWTPVYNHNGSVNVVCRLCVDGRSDFWPETKPLDITDIRGECVVKALRPIVDAAPTPSAAVRAAVEHIAALCDAEAARWTTYSAALRAQVAP